MIDQKHWTDGKYCNWVTKPFQSNCSTSSATIIMSVVYLSYNINLYGLNEQRYREPVHEQLASKIQNIVANLSLKRPTTSWCASVLYREWTSYSRNKRLKTHHWDSSHSDDIQPTIVIVYSCLSDVMVRIRITTIPPPSTVSMVLANKLGVNASKSCKTHMP